jgi:hypothetical protein
MASKVSLVLGKGHDGEPDLDNGGAGMSILQLMLMQTRGNTILLFPALAEGFGTWISNCMLRRTPRLKVITAMSICVVYEYFQRAGQRILFR